MKIKILGSGASTGVEKKTGRLPSSILIDNRLLVDATNFIGRQLKEKTIEAILITHAHSDAIGGLNQADKFIKNDIVNVYSLSGTIDILKKKFNKKFLNFISLKPKQEYEILDYKIIAYPVRHSVIFEMFDPTAAYKINSIIYCEDVDQDFFLSETYNAEKLKREMSKSSLTILDGAMCKGTIKGHLNIWDIIPELKKWDIKNVYFTQIGNTCPVHKDLVKNVNFKNPSFNVCYDGMVINVTSLKDKLEQITKDMDLTNISDTDLIGTHSVLHVWYKQGKTDWSKEDIWNLHKRLTEEMERRRMKHIPKDELDKGIQIHASNFLDELPNEIILQKGTVQLVGSFVEKEKYHDIDFNVRIGENDYVKRAIFARLDKLDMPIKKHIFFEPEGAHDKFIELYDLKLIKREKPELVEMSEIPQKPSSEAYYTPEDMVKDMFKQYDKWIVEKKWDGFHAMIKKKGDNVSIIAESGKNITIGFPSLCEDAKKLSDKDFIIDGELVYQKGNTFGTRRDLMKFIQGKKMDDSDIKFYSWDIPYFEKPIHNLKLYERKQIMKNIHWSAKIIQTGYNIVTQQQALAEIKKKSELPRSEGAVVKRLDAVYQRGEKSKNWLKYRKMADLNVIVLKKNAADSANNYSVGIILNEDESKKINPKYMIDFENKKVLTLGNTFNTGINATEENILAIKTEEIWRHESSDGIRYSLHKPRVQSLSNIKTTSTLRNLDDIVVSLGITIKEDELEDRSIEGLPFAGYKDFDDCVNKVMAKKGWPKERASAYCAVIKRTVEGSEELVSSVFNLYDAKLDGIIMVEPHGKMIWDGTKKLIVKSRKFDIAGKFFYLIEGDKCYGIAKITSVEKMTPELFDELSYLHKITFEEKEKWWGDIKEFWAYQFNLMTRYSVPLKVNVPQGVQTFVKGENIERLEEEFKNQILGPNDKPIRDFPQIIQADFRYVMDNKLKPRFVIHHHERGESLHSDIRLEIPNKNYLQGFTLANPANITQEDKINNNAANVLIVELKPPQPESWLMMEGKSEKGEPGSTAHKAGIFTVVAKGTYSIWEVSEHKIGIEFYCDKGKIKNIKDRLRKEEDLKDLKGQFSFTIAHIQPERWVGYFNHLKSKPVPIKMFDNPYVQELLENLNLALGNQPTMQKLTISSAILEELGKEFKMPYEFNFIALKEGEFNGIWYPWEELKKGCSSLKGKDVTIDHSKSVRDVVGKISDVWPNNELKQIEGKGLITDEEIAKKVHSKEITGVSVEVYVSHYEGEHGRSAKDPQFIALSLVVAPACRTCRIVPKTCL